MLSVRIVTVDSYMSPPLPGLDPSYSQFRGSLVNQVPVMRIFGVTPNGIKTCVHLHGVFPYIYVPVPEFVVNVDKLMYELCHALDKGLNTIMNNKNKKQHIFKITQVNGIPFYGYHSKTAKFLKIFFYRPQLIKKVVTMLENGSICDRKFQTFESHIPFILQFFIDYNLYGMSFLNLSKWTYRTEQVEDNQTNASQTVTKVTYCELEVDALCDDILNAQALSGNLDLNPGLAYIWEEEKARKRHEDRSSQISFVKYDNPNDPYQSSTALELKAELKTALKNRLKGTSNMGCEGDIESSNSLVLEASFRESHSQDIFLDSQMDPEIRSLLEGFKQIFEDNPDEIHKAEDDSILGSQVVLEEDNDLLEEDHDLTQPLEVFSSSESEDEIILHDPPTNPPEFWNQPSTSGINAKEKQIPFVDGSADENESYTFIPQKKTRQKRTPQKKTTPQKSKNIKLSPQRYKPLDVKIQKSPIRYNSKDEDFEKCLTALNESEFEDKRNKSATLVTQKNESYKNKRKRVIKKDKTNLRKKVLCTPPTLNRPTVDYNATTLNKYDMTTIDNISLNDSLTSDETKNQTRKYEVTNEPLKARKSLNFNNISSTDEIVNIIPESPVDIFADSQENLELANISQSSVESFYNQTMVASGDTPGGKLLTPQNNPPNKQDIYDNIKNLNLMSATVPFYGDPKDTSSGKEIGFNKITISSNFPKDLEDYKGLYSNGLLATQQQLYKTSFHSVDGDQKVPSDFVKTLTSKRNVVISPVHHSPNFSDAKNWMNTNVKKKSKLSNKQNSELVTKTSKKSEIATYNKNSKSTQQEVNSPKLQENVSLTFSPANSISGKLKDDNPDSPSLQSSSNYSSNKNCTILNSRRNSCLIDEATANNSGAFKMDFLNLQEAHATDSHKYVTLFILEAHIQTRGTLNPDPEFDEISAIFYTVTNDVPANCTIPVKLTGLIVPEGIILESLEENVIVTNSTSEKDMILKLIQIVRAIDPDILAGYEIEMLSWGYLIERANTMEINLQYELGRIHGFNGPPSFDKKQSQTQREYDLSVSGRIILNIWKMMRHEVSLMSYTFESMMYHTLHTRIPHYSFQSLNKWWTHFSNKFRHLTINYYLTRVKGIAQLLETLDLISRTSELASLFGIQFYEVLSRGSQFRVESMMLRLAKPQNYVPVSPNIQQRAAMRAPACLPLIMEPQSRYYTDPVIVLDFQSLYPSMMIAYNYCFSTCLGRVEELMRDEEIVFGCTSLKVSPAELLKNMENIHVSPAGVAFFDVSVRKGILPRMLEEILETRLMVKKSMKEHKDDKILQRILHARQLGLKLIANVTYGYTSANFSGRMPCIEVGDSVVSKGRETLERAIKMVHQTKRWEAEVIYGDTDSLFVLCPNKTKEEAFAIGQEIADAVTLSNPKPVKLKLEKVYKPCILQTKKRYVGYMYESPNQETPEFDAKGIETVRRDGCMAASKILEKSLKILFETNNMSQVKKYLCSQMAKITSGSLNIQDLIFAREYRGANGYQPGACVPALRLIKEWLARDRRAEPRVGERVGYVIVCGPPGVPLIRLVRSPHELLLSPSLQINAEYYITKVILPPVQRCLGLIGVDTLSWYKSQPKIKKRRTFLNKNQNRKETIAQYFGTVNCIICNELTAKNLCSRCHENSQMTSFTLNSKISSLERRQNILKKICESCCSRNYELECNSLDCLIYYQNCNSNKQNQQINFLRNIIEEFYPENSVIGQNDTVQDA